MRLIVLVLTLAMPLVASAESLVLNAGAIEVVGLEDGAHYGVYPYAGLSLALDTGYALVIPGVGVEWAPEFSRWGFVGTLVADFQVLDWLGVDVLINFIHDQETNKWSEALYYFGLGGGVTFVCGQFTVSPSVSVFAPLNGSGWSFVPGLNVGYSLPIE